MKRVRLRLAVLISIVCVQTEKRLQSKRDLCALTIELSDARAVA